jgi:hypothetical protein
VLLLGGGSCYSGGECQIDAGVRAGAANMCCVANLIATITGDPTTYCSRFVSPEPATSITAQLPSRLLAVATTSIDVSAHVVRMQKLLRHTNYDHDVVQVWRRCDGFRCVAWLPGSFPGECDCGAARSGEMCTTPLLCAESLKGPEIMALNPRGQVPCFKDGDVVVNESLAAMQYLEDVYGDVPLMPKEPAARGHALQRFHEANNLYTTIQPLFYAKMVGNVKTKADEVRLPSHTGVSKPCSVSFRWATHRPWYACVHGVAALLSLLLLTLCTSKGSLVLKACPDTITKCRRRLRRA